LGPNNSDLHCADSIGAINGFGHYLHLPNGAVGHLEQQVTAKAGEEGMQPGLPADCPLEVEKSPYRSCLVSYPVEQPDVRS